MASPNGLHAVFWSSIDPHNARSHDKAALTAKITSLATHYGRYGYRWNTAMRAAKRLAYERQAGGSDLAVGGA